MNKYELVNDDSIKWNGRTLCRVQALKDFGDVKKGDLGGYVESESNLSQTGNAWVYDNAKVYDDAQVIENAKIYSNAEVYGCARVSGNAQIADNAQVFDSAHVYEFARVYNNACVYGNDTVYGETDVRGYTGTIYYNTAAYAKEADERDEYFESLYANKRCADTIDRLISENHDGQYFDYDKVVDNIIKEFGAERVAVILAIQIQEHGSWDRRYSNENKNWAKSVRLPEKRDFVHLTAHPVLIDKVVSEVREYLSKSEHGTSNASKKHTSKKNTLVEKD